MGTEDTADDSTVVQICDGFLSLYNTTRAATTACETCVLKRAEVPGPETKSCAPVPREFRIKVVDSSNYLTGLAENDEQKLTTTPNYNEAVALRSAPGRDGQVTLVGADGRTLYSDQDIGGSGDGPIYFDDLGLSLASDILSETLY